MRPPQSNSLWTYQRLDHPVGIEASDWLGQRSPFLSTHLHDETQLSVVYSGLRSFRVGAAVFDVPAGSFVVIPAGVPHASVGKGGVQTCSRDIFVKPNSIAANEPAQILFGKTPALKVQELEEIVDTVINTITIGNLSREPLPLGTTLPAEIVDLVRSSDLSIADVAVASGLSREGFIRKFSRELGMTPHAYRVAHKASHARSMLRQSLAPAAAAQEAGFADQSHLGRIFRKNFGTTPAAFRRAWIY